MNQILHELKQNNDGQKKAFLLFRNHKQKLFFTKTKIKRNMFAVIKYIFKIRINKLLSIPNIYIIIFVVMFA